MFKVGSAELCNAPGCIAIVVGHGRAVVLLRSKKKKSMRSRRQWKLAMAEKDHPIPRLEITGKGQWGHRRAMMDPRVQDSSEAVAGYDQPGRKESWAKADASLARQGL